MALSRAVILLLFPVCLAAQARAPGPAPIPAGDWPHPGRDPQGTRFSPLTTLTPGNVGGLRVLWTFGTGSLRPHEGNPLVVRGRLYLATPSPTTVYAFDLDRPGDPPLWRWSAGAARDPAPPSVCCDVTIRGIAWHPSGRLIVPLHSGELAAIDAATGRQIWRVRNADPRAGESMPGAPLVAGDVVIVGIGGGEYGVRGHLTAYDVGTGERRWRAWSTGPDTEVLLDGPANLNYPSHQGRELGTRSWSADSWQRGGGATWGWLTWDPSLNLVYHGTGAPAPMTAEQRLGDNKWTSSLFARDPATGRARWALQLTPSDRWGYDASGESIVADLTVGGRAVRAIVHFDRNGFAYTIDRATGRMVLAEKYGPANWAARVDLSTGQPSVDPAFAPAAGRPASAVCPATVGMKAFQPAAWSPETGLFYLPLNNLCMDIAPEPVTHTPGRPFVGATIRMTPGPGGQRGRFVAWDATTGTVSWEIREEFPVVSGALATAGGLVFYGTLDGWLKAVDATSGRELWRFRTPSGILGSPVSFSAPDGRQYVAVVAGLGGWPAAGLDSAAPPTAGLGAAAVLGDLRGRANPGGVLLVFGLP